MVESVSAVNIKSQIDNFGLRKDKNYYFITQKEQQDIFIDENGTTKKNKRKKTGIIIGAASVISALVVFVATKGLPKNTDKFIKKCINAIEEKISRSDLKNGSKFIYKYYSKLLKGLNNFLKRCNSINNFTSVKDMIFANIMGKTKLTKKIHTATTKLFEKLSVNTVRNSYKKTNSMMSKLKDTFAKQRSLLKSDKIVTINGESKSVSEWLNILLQKERNAFGMYDAHFNSAQVAERYKTMKQCNIGLDKKVEGIALNGMHKGQSVNEALHKVKDSQIHQSFIAEDLLKQDKINLARQLSVYRDVITHDVFDNYDISKRFIDDIFNMVHPEDIKSLEVIKSLKQNLLKYKKISGSEEPVIRKEITQKILEELKLLQESMKFWNEKFGYNELVSKNADTVISNVGKVLKNDKKGELQEILTIYKELLPRKDYIKLKKSVYSSIKSLDKSINIEGDKFFDKLRDLSLGSAPTDVLTILASIAGVGIGLVHSDNKDERISALLTAGIPVIGGIATTMLLAVGLTAGFSSLAIGFASSIAMGKIGKIIDKHRKLNNKKNENEYFAQNVKEEIQKK